MKINIIFFSQTGNTSKIAEIIASTLSKEGHYVRLIEMFRATKDDFTQCDLLGIGCPCFASQAPTPVKDLLKTIPPLDNKPVFVFATVGMAPGRVLYDLTSLLQKKDSKIIGGINIRCKGYHPAPCLQGLFRERPNNEDINKVRKFSLAILNHLAQKKNGFITEGNPKELKFKLNFYYLVAFISKDSLLRILLPKPKYDFEKCKKCNWCVKECPMKNISLVPFPKVGRNCIRCYRCSTSCPNDAMKTNWRYGNIAIFTFYNRLFSRWFGGVKADELIKKEM